MAFSVFIVVKELHLVFYLPFNTHTHIHIHTHTYIGTHTHKKLTHTHTHKKAHSGFAIYRFFIVIIYRHCMLGESSVLISLHTEKVS